MKKNCGGTPSATLKRTCNLLVPDLRTFQFLEVTLSPLWIQ